MFIIINASLTNIFLIEGIPTRYGQAEPWKVIHNHIGRTKPSRAPDPSTKKRKRTDGRAPDTSKEIVQSAKRQRRNASDGRPPDTIKALKLTKTKTTKKPKSKKEAKSKNKARRKVLKRRRSHSSSACSSSSSVASKPTDEDGDGSYGGSEGKGSPKKRPNLKIEPRKAGKPINLGLRTIGDQSYSWSQNSCWLDTSTELIYIALSQGLDGRAWDEFSALFTDIPKTAALLPLEKALSDRKNVMLHAKHLDPHVLREHLSLQRDKLRKDLQSRKVINSTTEVQSLYVSHNSLLKERQLTNMR